LNAGVEYSFWGVGIGKFAIGV